MLSCFWFFSKHINPSLRSLPRVLQRCTFPQCFASRYPLGPLPVSSPRCLLASAASSKDSAGPARVHQNFHPDCEDAINRQINLELYASYVYLSMAYYFSRDDVVLYNFSSYFLHQSLEEREHAEKLMRLQNQGGGRISLQDIKKPDVLFI
ncbi:Ferritin, mitochondrial [Lemmus lemmus]